MCFCPANRLLIGPLEWYIVILLRHRWLDNSSVFVDCTWTKILLKATFIFCVPKARKTAWLQCFGANALNNNITEQHLSRFAVCTHTLARAHTHTYRQVEQMCAERHSLTRTTCPSVAPNLSETQICPSFYCDSYKTISQAIHYLS